MLAIANDLTPGHRLRVPWWMTITCLDPEDIKTILTVTSLYEDHDEVCDSPILEVESGFDRAEVDAVFWSTSRATTGSNAGP